MDHSSPLVSVRNELISFLKARPEFNYIDIREGYIKADTDKKLEKPLITVSKGKGIVEDISFRDYLGEVFSKADNEFIETKGKILNIYYDLHIWNNTTPKMGGEKEIERIIENIQSIVEFEGNALNDKGITFIDFEDNYISEDPFENDLFHSRCRLQVKVLWRKEFRYEVIDEIIVHGEIEEE